MFGTRYDPDQESHTRSYTQNVSPNFKKRRREDAAAAAAADDDDDVKDISEAESEPPLMTNMETEKTRDTRDAMDIYEESQESQESQESEIESGKETEGGDEEDAVDNRSFSDMNDDPIYKSKHKSVFDKFKQSIASTAHAPLQNPADLPDEEEEEEEETTETRDLAPLPQPQLPRDKKLQSTSHHLKNLDWLTEPEYISTTDTKSFSQYSLSPFMQKNLETLGFRDAFAVQVSVLNKMLPEIKANKLQPDAFGDILVNASTGSGKTLAYSIPIIESIHDRIVPRVRAIVIVPTKPLINQVRATMLQLAQGTNLNIVSMKNETSIQDESEKLRNCVPDVIISTPGRLVEHLNLESISLSNLRYLVVDEADRLLNQAFQNWSSVLVDKIEQQQKYDIANIWSLKVQKLIFSATLTTDAGKLAKLKFYKPRLLVVNDSQKLVNELFSIPATLSEYNISFGVAKSSIKPLILAKFLITHQKTVDVLIFTKSNESSIRLASLLQKLFNQLLPSLTVTYINSTNNRTSIRSRILKDFGNQKINILVATDLIARGLDLTSIKDVINYDLPNSSRDYVHRVGRTARANKPGNAYNFIVGKGESKWFSTFSRDVSRNNTGEVRELELDLKTLITGDDETVYQDALQELEKQAQEEEEEEEEEEPEIAFVVLVVTTADFLSMTDVQVFDQTNLEKDIANKANRLLLAKDVEQDEKRLKKAINDLNITIKHINQLTSKLSHPRTKLSEKKQITDQIRWLEENELAAKQSDLNDIKARLEENKKALSESTEDSNETAQDDGDKLPDETEREYLLRTGKITAFGNENAFQSTESSSGEKQSHVFLREPGFDENVEKLVPNEKIEEEEEEDLEAKDEDYVYNEEDEEVDVADEVVEDDDEEQEQEQEADVTDENDEISMQETRNIDDGDETQYQKRLKEWVRKRSSLRQVDEHPDDPEWFKPHPTIPDAKLNDTFKLPGDIYPSLFDYQKTCVQWLWELYSQKTGGIVGDEMGLGKTIQIISFLAGLHYSGLLDKPAIIVVPATVLNQWVNEFHRWWPPFRCVILHSIGAGMSKDKIISEEKLEEFMETRDPKTFKTSLSGVKSQINAREIVNKVQEKGHILVTTYVGLRMYSKYILPKQWGYCVLDEGHKIRNPDSDISLTCKSIKTVNRIILSGTPIQNNLTELWSLFDFVFPGRLGTLPVFEQQFSAPIKIGGYANSNNLQVKTAYNCAVVLRDLISPYLLRRLKKDVARDLPKKNEMVLFIKLTQYQQDMYEKFLESEDLDSIIKGKRNVLMGIDMLRKICNHPDLVYRDALMNRENYGDPKKSGKMQVLGNLLRIWQSEEHKTLLFCQTRQMLDILEKFVANLHLLKDPNENFTYLRMDGSTPIPRRQQLVDDFNSNPNLHVFLLTTKVGGLGVNLTGADRVIIYDPDWNPSTDIQARERAWRLGQKKDITIYRLMTTGSIEEKIYHRQIFKTFLQNKILKDPKQRRFFKNSDLHDLFTLGDQTEQGTETGDMFNARGEEKYGGTKTRKPGSLMKKKYKNDDDFYQVAKISGVSKLDKFENEEEERDRSDDDDDSRFIKGIFAESGVHSTLKHDEIVDSNDNETSLVEREANKYAKQAVDALKESRLLARKNKIGTPTWTGRFGSAGVFKGTFGIKKKRKTQEGVSSATILDNLKKINDLKQDKDKDKYNLDRQKTVSMLIDYLSKQENQFSTSNDIIKSNNLKMVSDEDMIIIRSMLREIAEWDGVRKGWKLKEQFVSL
ncbi:rhp26 [Candida oxycetoniae]|uniref:Rhp26 n=1 Tax=Candida oxycetoniae TaxID=497107 RepID=A0AAI9WVF4_9ASCO|nr:rhp26 [Candida oxycetoniae]KAI3402348.2 rhp26 [Candida oxycetoniae]